MSNKIPFLSLKNVTVKLGDKEIFPNTNWTVYSHEHWAIIGPNSSGKSTLMRAICGKIPVIDGMISYDFAPKVGAKPENHIAYVTFDAEDAQGHEPLFYQARWNTGIGEPGISVAETLSEKATWQRNPYEIDESPHINPHFDVLQNHVINQLNIADLLAREVQQLSNGERRKVSIARALLRQPKLLILDDIFEGLDPEYRKHLVQLLHSLMQASMRVFLVTSDPEKVPTSFDKILAIRDYKVVAQGQRGKVFANLRHTLSPGKSTEDAHTHTLPQQQNDESKILIRMRNVTISYNQSHILANVNWEVRRGERWALLGHNGAGKTTLLSLILGDNPQAYANDIELFGRRRGSGESIWDIKRRIGWMAPELHRHYPPLSSCYDVVCSGWFDSVGLYRKCTKEQLEAALAVMADLKIKALAQHQFRNISETEQRLVLLARALVKHPQLLILDEPCQGLDAHNRQLVYHILDSTTQWAESLILVTHQTHNLPKSITHSITLDRGQAASRRAYFQSEVQ